MEPGGDEPRPGEAKTTFEWLQGGQLLLKRSTVELPEAPDGVRVYGCDAAKGTYYQLYTQESIEPHDDGCSDLEERSYRKECEQY